MTGPSTHDRTVRLLEAKLEAIACRCEHSLTGPTLYEAQMLGALAATRNAVRLKLITSEEAGQIWAQVAQRHPAVPWDTNGPPIAA